MASGAIQYGVGILHRVTSCVSLLSGVSPQLSIRASLAPSIPRMALCSRLSQSVQMPAFHPSTLVVWRPSSLHRARRQNQAAMPAMEAFPTRLVEEDSDILDCPSDGSHQGFVEDSFGQQVYSFSQIEGEYTLQQLVAMDVAKDPLLKKVRRRDLPEAFWEARRHALNRRRTQRQKQIRKERLTEHRSGEVESAGQQWHDGRTEEEKQQAIQAHLEQQRRVDQALQRGLRVAVDCSLCPPGAAGREVRSLAKQLQLCVGANKRARAPLSLHFVGFAGPVAEFAVGRMNALRWPAVHLKEAPALEVFPREQVVLLSPDAEEPLVELDPSKVYVIGGLVDRSAQKHATATFAQQQGIACARLPTREFLEPAQQAQRGQQAEHEQQGGANGCQPRTDIMAQLGQHLKGLGKDQGRARDTAEQLAHTAAVPGCQPRAQSGCNEAGPTTGHPLNPSSRQQEGEAQESLHGVHIPVGCKGSPPHYVGQAAGADVTRGSSPTLSQAAWSSQQQLEPHHDEQHDHEQQRQQQQQQGQPLAGAHGRAAGSPQQGRKEGSLILNINDVVDILLAVNAGDAWGVALHSFIPQRKRQQKFGSKGWLADGGVAQTGAKAAVRAEAAAEAQVEAGLASLTVCDGP